MWQLSPRGLCLCGVTLVTLSQQSNYLALRTEKFDPKSVWAIAYNIVAIPVAAGLFVPLEI